LSQNSPKLKHLRKIAIDEFSVGKNHDYFTQVLDLDTGKVVFVGEGKGADALVPFWKRLKSSKASIQAVAIDMSPAYISAVLNNLPRVPIVFDRFHVVKMLNEKISNIRRQIYNKLDDEEQQKVLKRQAYGFRDREFFKLKIMALHEAKYALVG
jgi:transposase